MAIAPELRAQILRLYQAERWRIGTIANQLHLHRDTVQRVAIIDFDDAAFGWRMYDIAVALTHQQAAADFAAVRDAFLSGYRKVRALPEAEAAQLPLFLLVRGLVQLGWLHERPEIDPGDWLPSQIAQVRRRCQALLAE
jgi:Ser/Thr protein kinase RdoA (MazF antagonist)